MGECVRKVGSYLEYTPGDGCRVHYDSNWVSKEIPQILMKVQDCTKGGVFWTLEAYRVFEDDEKQLELITDHKIAKPYIICWVRELFKAQHSKFREELRAYELGGD